MRNKKPFLVIIEKAAINDTQYIKQNNKQHDFFIAELVE